MPARALPPRHRPTRLARRLAALVPIAAAALALAAPSAPHALPRCDAEHVLSALERTLETIPALSGRDARLLRLERARSRGHAGRRPLRACQGRLVTTVGSGGIEYSIRPAPGAAMPFTVRAELFQGGWRRELLPEPP